MKWVDVLWVRNFNLAAVKKLAELSQCLLVGFSGQWRKMIEEPLQEDFFGLLLPLGELSTARYDFHSPIETRKEQFNKTSILLN